jgi:hypothetical protein
MEAETHWLYSVINLLNRRMLGVKKLTAEEWIEYGLKNGWCGPPVCYTHDALPTSADEDEEFEDGDPCITVIRMYDNGEMKKQIEENHSPSIWRKGSFNLD